APDRYGRQHAFVAAPGEASVQVALLDTGLAFAAGTGTDPGCAAELARAEAAARKYQRGVWSTPDVIKNAESPGDILAKLGRFAVVEGKVASARQAGATFYLNFGPRWTRDFAVIIRKPMLELLTRDNLDLKRLAGRRVRIRGWIERRGGPRIELRDKGQIEILDPL
ncbi:MAG: thermonuclease family protein, partial [Xanthobacteraceae bacterium]